MNDHDHPHPHDHDHDHDREHGHGAPETPVDAGSVALAEALRSSFSIVKFVMAILVIAFLGSGFFQVGSQEQAIILRFGKPVGEGKRALLGTGLHFAFPYPIDEVVKVPIIELQQVKSTVGWYAVTDVQEAAGTEPPAGPSLNPAIDGYTLTGDNNIVHTRATLRYRIEDPKQYVFGFTNTQKVVQNALNNALVSTAARFNIDDILNRDVAGFRDAVTVRVAQLLESEHTGVTVDLCDVQSSAPRQVKASFENVLKAEINRNNVLNVARSYENQVMSKAGADSQSLTNAAESDRVRRVSEMASLAGNFAKILPDYRRSPQLFVQMRLNEVIGRAMTNTEKWVTPVSTDGKNTELRILLNREPAKPKTQETPQ